MTFLSVNNHVSTATFLVRRESYETCNKTQTKKKKSNDYFSQVVLHFTSNLLVGVTHASGLCFQEYIDLVSPCV